MERTMKDPATAGCRGKRGGRGKGPEPWEQRGLQHAKRSWVGCPGQEEEGESCPCKTPGTTWVLHFSGWVTSRLAAGSVFPSHGQARLPPVPRYHPGAGLGCHWGVAGSWVRTLAARFIPHGLPCSVCLPAALLTANETPLTPGLRQ